MIGDGGVVQQQDVILIAAQSVFVAALRAEDQPLVGHRRLAQFGLRQLQQPSSGGVADRRHQAVDLGGAGVLCDQLRDQAWQPGGDRGQAVRGGLLGDVADQEDRVGGLQPHQITGRDQPEQAIVVDDRQVVETALHHHQHRLDRRGVRVDGGRRGGHDGRHRPLGRSALADDQPAHVAVGDDPAQLSSRFPAVPGDQQRRHPAVGHQPGRGADRGALVDAHRLMGDDPAQRGPQHLVAGLRHPEGLHRRLQPLGRLLVEEPGEQRLGAQQLTEVIGPQQQREAVLQRGHGESRGSVVTGRRDPERAPLTAAVGQRAVGVGDVDRPAAQDVDRLGRPTGGQDDRAPTEVPAGQARRQLVEQLLRQHVEGVVGGQEVPDPGELDVHRPPVADADPTGTRRGPTSASVQHGTGRCGLPPLRRGRPYGGVVPDRRGPSPINGPVPRATQRRRRGQHDEVPDRTAQRSRTGAPSAATPGNNTIDPSRTSTRWVGVGQVAGKQVGIPSVSRNRARCSGQTTSPSSTQPRDSSASWWVHMSSRA
ncbi:hypothetical protein SDC9_100150 [bioreactor metagenome]|uniref:Uncharacterized protein n=1 Tax=bioreactor metagenome TaxID=1076179 RepID=A0A645ARA1_9ZZZZ